MVSKDIEGQREKQMSRSVVFHDTVTAIAINCKGILMSRQAVQEDFLYEGLDHLGLSEHWSQ